MERNKNYLYCFYNNDVRIPLKTGLSFAQKSDYFPTKMKFEGNCFPLLGKEGDWGGGLMGFNAKLFHKIWKKPPPAPSFAGGGNTKWVLKPDQNPTMERNKNYLYCFYNNDEKIPLKTGLSFAQKFDFFRLFSYTIATAFKPWIKSYCWFGFSRIVLEYIALKGRFLCMNLNHGLKAVAIIC